MRFMLFALISIVSWLFAQTFPDPNARMLVGWTGGAVATWCYAVLEQRANQRIR